MNAQLRSLDNLLSFTSSRRVLLAVIEENDHNAVTELMTRLALAGTFHLISNGHWLPDQDSLRRCVRRYTVAVNEILDHIILGRPATCLQLRAQLEQADALPYPILVLDFLHYFYDPDVDLSLRERVLGQCCQQVRHLSQSRSVIIFVNRLPTEEYQNYVQSLITIADEILEAEENGSIVASQYSFL